MATAKKSKSASKPSTARPTTETDNEAIAQLTADHARVKKLFKQYDRLAKSEADSSERQELAMTICAELTAHATAEEEIFYPAAREALDDADLIDEAEVEHASAKDLIAQIQSASPETPTPSSRTPPANRIIRPSRIDPWRIRSAMCACRLVAERAACVSPVSDEASRLTAM